MELVPFEDAPAQMQAVFQTLNGMATATAQVARTFDHRFQRHEEVICALWDALADQQHQIDQLSSDRVQGSSSIHYHYHANTVVARGVAVHRRRRQSRPQVQLQRPTSRRHQCHAKNESRGCRCDKSAEDRKWVCGQHRGKYPFYKAVRYLD